MTTPSAIPKKQRRTQTERREQSIRKILDAATEILIEVGYASATIQRIAERAGLSQGGLFRHFATREAVMMAVGEDVAGRILAGYRRDFESMRQSDEPLVVTVRLLRDTCRSTINQAWLELSHASRTNPALRAALEPIGRRYAAQVVELARELLPDLAESLGERFPMLVDTVVAIFDGEIVHRSVFSDPELEAQRLDAVVALVRLLPAAMPAAKNAN